MSGDCHRFGVHHRDAVLVFNVDVNMALFVGRGLFRRAAQVDGSNDRAVTALITVAFGARWLKM